MRLDAEEIEGRIRVSQANILGFAFSIGEERHEQLKGAPLPIESKQSLRLRPFLIYIYITDCKRKSFMIKKILNVL